MLRLQWRENRGKNPQVADDMQSNDLEMLAVQETHMTTVGPDVIETSDEEKKYIMHNFGKDDRHRAGVEIIVKKGIKASFTPV